MVCPVVVQIGVSRGCHTLRKARRHEDVIDGCLIAMVVECVDGKGVEWIECINGVVVEPGFPKCRGRVAHVVVIVEIAHNNNVWSRLVEKRFLKEIAEKGGACCGVSRRCIDNTHFEQQLVCGVDRSDFREYGTTVPRDRGRQKGESGVYE